MVYEYYENIFNEFKTMWPNYENDVADYRPNGSNSIVIRFNDGTERPYCANKHVLKFNTIRQPGESLSSFIKRRFANNLRFYMGTLGYVDASLAKKIGVSQKTVNNYINGRQAPTIELVANIAEVLGRTYEDLME